MSVICRIIVWFAVFGCGLYSSICFSSSDHWADTFYQYRLPIDLEVKKKGWNIVAVNPMFIIASLNRIEEFKYDTTWFAYDQIKVVEIDKQGKVIADKPEAAFYLIDRGGELFSDSSGDTEISTRRGGVYLIQFIAEGGGAAPNFGPAIFHSYLPALLKKERTLYKYLVVSDGKPIHVGKEKTKERTISDISVKQVEIGFLSNEDSTGLKQWMLYYQPLCGNYLTIPPKHVPKAPRSFAPVYKTGPAEKYLGITQYQVAENDLASIWFAESTVKLTPHTGVPAQSRKSISVSCAKNEAQSLQIVLSIKNESEFKGIRCSDLVKADDSISAESIEWYALDYVPIKQKTRVVGTNYQGMIGDPLVEVVSHKTLRAKENFALLCNMSVSRKTPAGSYKGTITIEIDDKTIEIPVSLEVYDFVLPEYSTFQSNMGGQYFAKPCPEKGKTILQYHGLKTKDELKKLARSYYDVMAKNKFSPKTAVLYSEIGMKWSPPPEGYNVDKPGNYFKLYDWDFSEYNRDLKHYIEDLKVNSFTLNHTNPLTCNIFKHLPGKEVQKYPEESPHVSMAWQTFREPTYVGWGNRKSDPYYNQTIEITRDQYDRLILDYYRTLAKNLEDNGWLDYFYIFFDELPHHERILHFLQVLKSDPLTAKIKVIVCVQSMDYYTYKDAKSGDYAYKGLITYVPQNDEGYNRWEKYYFNDYEIEPKRKLLWNYSICSSRIVIDTFGINNRIIGLDIFNRGGNGFLDWDTFVFDTGYGATADNPWIDPYCVWGNGALSYFYPPLKDGLSAEPNYTITPSLRVMTFRESVDDFEYAKILEDLVIKAKQKKVSVSEAEAVLHDIERFFHSSVHWSQNDAWYLALRDRIARAIVKLTQRVKE